jgi:hypothetical protein
MSNANAMNQLSIKISRDDMQLYTNVLYADMADPAINGIDTHAASTTAHDLPAQFSAVYGEIDRIDDELATKIGSVDLSNKADVTGDTFTGIMDFTAANVAATISGSANTDRAIVARTGTENRWELSLASNDNEIGGNKGSNFVVTRYDDNGNFLGIPFVIDRETGVTYVDQLQVGGGDVLVGEGIDVRLQQSEPTDNLKLGTVWLRPDGDGFGGYYVGPTAPLNPVWGDVWIELT